MFSRILSLGTSLIYSKFWSHLVSKSWISSPSEGIMINSFMSARNLRIKHLKILESSPSNRLRRLKIPLIRPSPLLWSTTKLPWESLNSNIPRSWCSLSNTDKIPRCSTMQIVGKLLLHEREDSKLKTFLQISVEVLQSVECFFLISLFGTRKSSCVQRHRQDKLLLVRSAQADLQKRFPMYLFGSVYSECAQNDWERGITKNCLPIENSLCLAVPECEP